MSESVNIVNSSSSQSAQSVNKPQDVKMSVMFSISSLPKHHHPLTKMDCDLPNGFDVCDRAVVCPDVRHDVRRTFNTMLLVPFAWCEVSPALYVLEEVPYARSPAPWASCRSSPAPWTSSWRSPTSGTSCRRSSRRARGREGPPRGPGGPPCGPQCPGGRAFPEVLEVRHDVSKVPKATHEVQRSSPSACSEQPCSPFTTPFISEDVFARCSRQLRGGVQSPALRSEEVAKPFQVWRRRVRESGVTLVRIISMFAAHLYATPAPLLAMFYMFDD